MSTPVSKAGVQRSGELGERGLGPGCSPQHGQEMERGDTLGLTSRYRTASSSCRGRSRQSPYSGTPSCDETAQPLPRSAAPTCSSASLSWASTQRPRQATTPPPAPVVGTLTFHPTLTTPMADGTPSSSQTPLPASSKTTCAAHLSLKLFQLALGFASSRSLLLFFFFPLPTERLGNLWVMDSRLRESWMVRPEFLAPQTPPASLGKILASKDVDCHLPSSGSRMCDPGQGASFPSP